VRSARLRLLFLAIGLTAHPALASAKQGETILQYIRSRDDVSGKERAEWEKELKKRFGGAMLKEETEDQPEVAVAKAVIAGAIFREVDPKKGAVAAFEGYRGALGYVPPPIAIHYQLLALEGRKPRGRPLDLAFNFPKFYVDEIAPDLVAFWEDAISKGKVPDFALAETKAALDETRLKMRPLLVDKLRLLARLARDRDVAKPVRRAEIESFMKEIEAELARSFTAVPRRPEVIDARKRPYDRLRIQLEDMGLRPTEDDRLLDPDAPPPPPKEPPKIEPPVNPQPGEEALEEPVEAPKNPPPPQPRAGDPSGGVILDRLLPSALKDLIGRYKDRLAAVVTPWLGTPYSWGSDLRGAGTDCSGFTRRVYTEGFAIDLPRVSRDQFRFGRSVSKEELRPGDLVFFDTKDSGGVNHVGIYLGDGSFVHASSSKGVTYADLKHRHYQRAYRGARRILAYPPSAGS
jgi:hypothetical protein